MADGTGRAVPAAAAAGLLCVPDRPGLHQGQAPGLVCLLARAQAIHQEVSRG
jgi:hypothetical protein